MTGQPSQPEYELPGPGALIAGKYRVERLLGKGGMGAVFAARHERLKQRVAVKLLLAEIAGGAEAVSRFLNEAQAAAQIQSENVARVMDVDILENGLPYIVMEYLEGQDLSQVLESRGPIGVSEAVDYILQGLEALAQAHALGIVHRDLKPANLFLAKRPDGTSIVKVLDFGISKATNPLSGVASGAMTSTKALLGSPYYMSPEQLRSSKNVDGRADIWSIGVILYELLTCSLPFVGENLGELFANILEQEPPPLRARRPDVTPDFERIVFCCLQRKPENRFPTVAELAAAIAPYAPGGGALSLQRIRGSMPRAASTTSPHASTVAAPSLAQSGSGAFAAHPAVLALPAAQQTNASWGNTGAPAPSARRNILLIGLAALGVIVLMGVAGWGLTLLKLKRESRQAAASSASAASSVPIVPSAVISPSPASSDAVTLAEPLLAATDAGKPSAPTISAPPPEAPRHHGAGTPPAIAPPKPVVAPPKHSYDPGKDTRT